MDISTAITLLTINVIVLSFVILVLIIGIIVLIVKFNKIANNIQQTSANVANITEWLSPVKVFGVIASTISVLKKR